MLDLVEIDLNDGRFEMTESMTHDTEMLDSVNDDAILDNDEEKENSKTINRGRGDNRQLVGHGKGRAKEPKPERGRGGRGGLGRGNDIKKSGYFRDDVVEQEKKQFRHAPGPITKEKLESFEMKESMTQLGKRDRKPDDKKDEKPLPEKVEPTNVLSSLLDTDMLENASEDDDILDNDEDEKEVSVTSNRGRGGGRGRGRGDNRQFVGHGRGGAKEQKYERGGRGGRGGSGRGSVLKKSGSGHQANWNEADDANEAEEEKQPKKPEALMANPQPNRTGQDDMDGRPGSKGEDKVAELETSLEEREDQPTFQTENNSSQARSVTRQDIGCDEEEINHVTIDIELIMTTENFGWEVDLVEDSAIGIKVLSITENESVYNDGRVSENDHITHLNSIDLRGQSVEKIKDVLRNASIFLIGDSIKLTVLKAKVCIDGIFSVLGWKKGVILFWGVFQEGVPV